ncbi:MAG: Gldg family protein, partial [bacterium]|nr:Gldg family protein [bacterium]
MKRFFLLQAAMAALLTLGLIVVSGRLVRLAGPISWDVAGRDPSTLPAGLSRWLGELKGEPQGVLDATLFVSKRSRMPSHLQDVEQTTRALLAAMEDAAGGAFRYRVIDPDDSGEAGARYAATRGVSPIRVRQVVDDAESQIEIWSSLVVSRRGAARRHDILIQGIENAHLPHLAALLEAHLQGPPPQASFALSAPPGFGEMPRYLSQYGPVIEVDVDATATMPSDVDILFWIEPQHVTQRHIESLRRFLASGRTAVVAGSPYHVRYEQAGGNVRFRAERSGDACVSLLEPFGL